MMNIGLCCANSAQIIKCGCKVAAATNENDVIVTQTICGSVVVIIALFVVGFLLWKWMGHCYSKWGTIRQHKWEREDRERTKRANLQEKKMAALKELCYVTNEKDKKELKRDGDENKNYLEAIEALLNEK